VINLKINKSAINKLINNKYKLKINKQNINKMIVYELNRLVTNFNDKSKQQNWCSLILFIFLFISVTLFNYLYINLK